LLAGANDRDGGRERCHHVYQDGESFTFHVDDRWTVLRWDYQMLSRDGAHAIAASQ
jgi:hypothetical protein